MVLKTAEELAKQKKHVYLLWELVFRERQTDSTMYVKYKINLVQQEQLIEAASEAQKCRRLMHLPEDGVI